MKALLFIVALTISTVACHGMKGQVTGSGNRQVQTRDVPAFTSIRTEGAFEIDVVSQKERSLEIEADDNLLPLISTTVSNNILYIKSSRNLSTREGVRIKIGVPDLQALTAYGAGNIEVSKLKNNSFEIDVNGAPTVEVSGDTGTLKIEANGAGKIDAHRLNASEATVSANGVAKVSLHARDKLDVTVSGPSHVTYDGDPMLTKHVNGPGTVEKKESAGE